MQSNRSDNLHTSEQLPKDTRNTTPPLVWKHFELVKKPVHQNAWMRWESPFVELELPLSCQLKVFAAVGMSFRCSYVPIGLWFTDYHSTLFCALTEQLLQTAEAELHTSPLLSNPTGWLKLKIKQRNRLFSSATVSTYWLSCFQLLSL